MAATYDQIKAEIAEKQHVLAQIDQGRAEVDGRNGTPTPRDGVDERHFKLLAQGDSWFDYLPGTDLVYCLQESYGHTVTKIAVAGSTLNDEAYGPVPRGIFGPQAADVSRIAELVHRILSDKPRALLLSGGGNDIAGDEFFSVINNAKSGLPPVNDQVLDGIVDRTFRAAYEYLITNALEAATEVGITMPIFLHSYDYPWPDGRGVVHFLGWNIGPWFDPSFNHKNYPNKSPQDLAARHDILKPFVDQLHALQIQIAAQFAGKVFAVDFRGTLISRDEWANELHPTNAGFAKLAAKLNAALQTHVP